MNFSIFRIKNGSVLGGVINGIAYSLKVDPTLLRVIWIISLFFSFGISFIAYFVLWGVLPEVQEPAESITIHNANGQPIQTGSRENNSKLIAFMLIGLGVFLAVDDWHIWDAIKRLFWPIVFIAIGVYLYLQNRK